MNERMLSGAPLILALLAAGCATPRAEPVVAPIAEVGLGTTPAPAIAADWWTAFGDRQLNRIMADALAGSPTLDAAMARVRQAEAQVAARGADAAPQMTLDAEEQRVRLSGRYTIPPPYGGSTRWLGQVTGNFSWTLDFWGRQAAAIRQAGAARDAALLDAEAARLTLTGTIAQTYVELVRNAHVVAIAKASLARRQDALKLVRVRIRTQLASELDARSAETLVAQADQLLVRAEGQRRMIVHALAALAGRGADYHATIGAPSMVLDGALPLPAGLPADLLARRPDILAAQARITAATEGRTVARTAFYPNIDLIGVVGAQAVSLGSLFSDKAATYGAGAALHLPIFDGGRLRADHAGATAALDLAVADYNRSVVDAVREAADAIDRIDTARGDLSHQQQVLTSLQETSRLNQVRIRAGLDSPLDAIAPDIRELDAQLGVASLEADAALYRIQLLIAVGGGFSAGGPS